MSAVPPRHVCIAGALLISLGTWALMDVLVKLLGGKVSLEITILYLPIGYGILLGKESSRVLGRVFAIIGLLVCLGVFALVRYGYFNTSGDDLGREWGLTFATVAPMFVMGYVYIVLGMNRYRVWFTEIQKVEVDARTIFWSVVTASVLAAGSYHLSKWQSQLAAQKSFVYHVAVKPYDNTTGDGLRSIRYDVAEIKKASMGELDLPQPVISTQAADNQVILHLLGAATNAFEFTLKCDGYGDQKVSVERSNAGTKEIRVPMEPRSPAGGANVTGNSL